MKEVYIIKASELTAKQQREFIIKDNVGFGEWDWDMLANEWDNELLNEWGLDVWNNEEIDIDNMFEDVVDKNESSKYKIILEYSNEDDYNYIIIIILITIL